MASIPDFKELTYYNTKTLVIYSNMEVFLEKTFNHLPVVEYIKIKKKRGRKNKNVVENPNEHIPIGSIISIWFNGKLRGVNLKKEKKKKSKRKRHCFPNSMNTKIILEHGKMIDFKLTNKGISMTGCTDDIQHLRVFYYLYKHILETQELIGESLFKFVLNDVFKNNYLTIISQVVMKNYSFNIGCRISSNNLYSYISDQTPYKTSYNPDNSAQVIIKIPSKAMDVEDENKLECAEFIDEININLKEIPYKELAKSLKIGSIASSKKSEKEYTFMVFHTGSVTVTGNSFKMKEAYNEFKGMISDNLNIFKEVLT